MKKLVSEFSKVKSKTPKHSPGKEESGGSLAETVCKRELRSQETPEKTRSLLETPLRASAPPKGPGTHPKEKSFVSEADDLPYLSTTEMYLCRWHQPPPSPLPLREPSPKKEETVASKDGENDGSASLGAGLSTFILNLEKGSHIPRGSACGGGKVPCCWFLPLRCVLALDCPKSHLGLTLLWAGLLAGVWWSSFLWVGGKGVSGSCHGDTAPGSPAVPKSGACTALSPARLVPALGTGLCQVAQHCGSDRAWHMPGSASALLVCLAQGVEIRSAALWLAGDRGLSHGCQPDVHCWLRMGVWGILSHAPRGRMGRKGVWRWWDGAEGGCGDYGVG